MKMFRLFRETLKVMLNGLKFQICAKFTGKCFTCHYCSVPGRCMYTKNRVCTKNILEYLASGIWPYKPQSTNIQRVDRATGRRCHG